MYGVAGANNAIRAIARGLAKGVDKKLMRLAIVKGAIYPTVKKVSKWFGFKMTAQFFRSSINKAIPVIGGVVGGGITFLSFKPCCDRLKKELQNTMLANPAYQETVEETEFYEGIISGHIIEAEFIDADENPSDFEFGEELFGIDDALTDGPLEKNE